MDEETVRKIVREEIELSKNEKVVAEESRTSIRMSISRILHGSGLILGVIVLIVSTSLMFGPRMTKRTVAIDVSEPAKFSEKDFATLVPGDIIVDKKDQVWEVVEPLKEYPAASSNFFGGHGKMIKLMSLKKIDDQLKQPLGLSELLEDTKEIRPHQ